MLSMVEAISQELANELKAIRDDLSYIKEHMVDIDSIMTEEDFIALKEYKKEKKSGKLVSHEQLKKELAI